MLWRKWRRRETPPAWIKRTALDWLIRRGRSRALDFAAVLVARRGPKAVVAIDRARSRRPERHFVFFAALRAGYGVGLARAAAETSAATAKAATTAAVERRASRPPAVHAPLGICVVPMCSSHNLASDPTPQKESTTQVMNNASMNVYFVQSQTRSISMISLSL